jgi:hypothetical protein
VSDIGQPGVHLSIARRVSRAAFERLGQLRVDTASTVNLALTDVPVPARGGSHDTLAHLHRTG